MLAGHRAWTRSTAKRPDRMTAGTASLTLYGQPGWGSAIVEAMLVVAGLPFEFIDVDGFIAPDGINHPTPGRDRLAAVNPLLQVPTLVLGDGSVMTESAAIALYIGDLAPASGLVPSPASPERARFLRWLVWIVTNIYPTFTYGDFPDRWCDAPDSLRVSTDQYRERLWRQCEQSAAAPWFLGQQMSAIDLYLAVMVRWRPREAWFDAQAPQLAAIARKTAALPGVREVMERNFPG
jgi:GST-like protein